MTTDYRSRWEQCRKIIRDNISLEQYNTIFAFVEFDSFTEGKLVLCVPSAFVTEVIEEKYKDLMIKVLRRCFGNISLFYRILKDKTSGTTVDEEGIEESSNSYTKTGAPSQHLP